MTLALLHTSPVHVPVFDALRDRDHAHLELHHVVAPELLAGAREHGPEAVAAQVGDLLAEAVAGGAGAVLCTCSTIGAVAESQAAALGVPVLRVDRPMAAEAARLGGRVVVLAAVESTLGPTAALLEEESLARAGGEAPLSVETRLVPGAWDRFEAGDADGYIALVARAVEAVTATAPTHGTGVGVVVLAQASMAPAAAAVAATDVPVLASPVLGLAAAARAAAGTGTA
ncbi:aspartate/glutamate racemase family protein [Streptomyces sp. NRRL S-87]|uniref:aspartate/glutamate racemase family protein n=1 Tax=Streptomyces sp. NRRL S-87 TaxID=1463920 RepID=UPI0004C230A8|nr:aspartate/glutamate racemase family protein [Streptomyces sp. NRRL S-87]